MASDLGLIAHLLPFAASASRRRRRTGAALFAAELVPVVGVAVLGWSLGEMLFVYFCEAVILAALVPIKIAVIAFCGPLTFRRLAVAVLQTTAWIFLGYWILYVYGVLVMGVAHVLEFTRFKPAGDEPLAHVLLVMTGAIDVFPTAPELLAHPLVLAVLAFLAAELYAFFVHFIGEREHRHGAGRHMAQVGGRLGVLHVCLVYGGLLVMFPLLAFAPAAAAPVMTAAFVLAKIWFDLRAHERDHAALAS